MSPPYLGIEGEGLGNVSLLSSSSSSSQNCTSKNVSDMKERDYLALSNSSSSVVECPTKVSKGNLNLKATELRLGLPGSESPESSSEKLLLFPLLPSKDGIYSSSSSSRAIVSGNKRGFSDTINEFPPPQSTVYGTNVMNMISNKSCETKPTITSGECLPKTPMSNANANGSTTHNKTNGSNAKAQVVGWPPVRSFRKNILTNTSKNDDDDEVDGKQSPGGLFVKVSMDGAPYLRKVDLRIYSTYQQLSSALEQMFSCFTLGKPGGHEGPGTGSENKLRASLHGSEYVLTFEDKDGDWMLVGDVPWEMFIESCKKLKIMKGSDAIGLGM